MASLSPFLGGQLLPDLEGVVLDERFNSSNFFDTNCGWPISGPYCLLVRVYFYVLLAFVVVWRRHPWLIAGALASALTYSATAAIHSMGLAWYKASQVQGEQDIIALWAILSSSCVLAVPLLNWSTTIQKDLQARRIIMFWYLIISIGFYCSFAMLLYGAKDWTASIVPEFTWSMCRPNGPVNASEVVNRSSPGYPYFPAPVDQTFLIRYNCTQPCKEPYVQHRTQFRARGSLQLLTMEQTYGKPHNKSFKSFVGGTTATTILTFPIVVFLGLYTLLFPDGRPREVRNSVFRFCAGITRSSKTNANSKVLAWRRYAAQFVAIIIYIITILTLTFCIPMFVLNIIAMELAIKDYSQSEEPYFVGQWAPIVGAVLAVLAAMVDQYWTTFARLCVDFFKQKILRRPRSQPPQTKVTLPKEENARETDIVHRRQSDRRQTFDVGQGSSHESHQSKPEYYYTKGPRKLLRGLSSEWSHFSAFCRDPVKECRRYPPTSSRDNQYINLDDGSIELSRPTKHGAVHQLLPSHQTSRISERHPKASLSKVASEEVDEQPQDQMTADIESGAQSSSQEQELRSLHTKHA